MKKSVLVCLGGCFEKGWGMRDERGGGNGGREGEQRGDEKKEESRGWGMKS